MIDVNFKTIFGTLEASDLKPNSERLISAGNFGYFIFR